MANKVGFDLYDLAETLRTVAAERPSHVYAPVHIPGQKDLSRYWHPAVDGKDAECGCIYGHALLRLGVKLEPLGGRKIQNLLIEWFGGDCETPAYMAFQRVQDAQDGTFGRPRRSWADSVRYVDGIRRPAKR